MSTATATRGGIADGTKAGAPTRLLRLEGAALLAGSLLAYTTTGRPWWVVPLTLLLPDLSAVGYLGGTDHDQLFTRDGWMRMGDMCEIDAEGFHDGQRRL